MTALRILAFLVASAFTALASPIGGASSTSETDLVSRSSQTVNNPIIAIQNLLSTQILAKGPGGQVIFDQTLFSAFTDPTVQALVTQASLALNSIGFTSILGPSLISSSVVSEGISVVTLQTSRREDFFLVGPPSVVVTFGPAAITIGELVCQSFTVTSPIFGQPSGCTGGTPYVVGENETNFNTRSHFLTTIFQDVTTTETFRTTEVYLLQAQDSSSPSAIPEPGTLGMLIVCLPVLAALRSRRSK